MSDPLPATVLAALQRRWQLLVASPAVSSTLAASAWSEVAAHYGENGRFYHTLSHVHHVLTTVETLEPAPSPALQLAAWLHDVIYDPRRSDNEAASAAFARRLLRRWAQPQALVQRVSALILATKTHAAGDDWETAVLLDADLAILGAEWETYQAYARAIRREYHFVSPEAYRSGRVAVLQRFLQRPHIYQTPQFLAHRETAARANLRREIDYLTTA